jgi:hypothetical protein
MKQVLSNKIVSREDITSNTAVPIIAEVGHYYGGANTQHERCWQNSRFAEQFRVFRTNMEFITKQKPCPVILITSYLLPGKVNHLSASSLASVYAYGGKKGFIDGDGSCVSQSCLPCLV